jgi:hypothetical protein
MAPCVYADQPRYQIGAGIGLKAEPIDDQFEINEITNPIPINGLFGYYSAEFPILVFPLENPRYQVRIGANLMSMTYREKPETTISDTQKERQIYEITSLHFYSGLQYLGQPLGCFQGDLVGGIVVSETVMGTAVETYQISRTGEEQFSGVRKTYDVGYYPGLMTAAGFDCRLSGFGRIGLQVSLFLVQTGLKLPDGHSVNLGVGQLLLYYTYEFD